MLVRQLEQKREKKKLTVGSEFRFGFPYLEQLQSMVWSVMSWPLGFLRRTVACAAMSISAPKVLFTWARCIIQPGLTVSKPSSGCPGTLQTTPFHLLYG